MQPQTLTAMDIEDKLKKLPSSPGIYMMKDGEGTVLYIGKAKNLRSRVRSYFRTTGDGRYAVRFLATRTEDIDVIVTSNEKEALFLEDTLLKKHKPRYNIRLKDSKTYVSIKITLGDRFPRILTTRQIKKDGSRYFGPYVSARAVRETIKFIRGIFPLCVCSRSVFSNRTRPCLDYQLGLCSAPAVGLISEQDYRELVDGAVMFLEGKNTELVRDLKKKMAEAAGALDFEKAAGLRDRIEAIEEMLEEQRVVSHRRVDRDIVGYVTEDGDISIRVLYVRDGRLVGSDGFFFEDMGLPGTEVLDSFITQFYHGERYIPDEVIIPVRFEDADVVAEWLSDKKGKKVPLTAPARGEKLKLLKMAEENARESLRKKSLDRAARSGVLAELKRRLHLSVVPAVIEAFDISNIGGRQTVGAMVRFRDGEADKSGYRLYRVRGVEGPDDYASMHEVLSRRFAPLSGEAAGAAPSGPAPSEGPGAREPDRPDLVLIDGGKGQLNIAVKVFRELGITGVELAALAKDKPGAGPPVRAPGARVETKGERVFRPNVKDPILLREGSRPDLLLRRIRDEVHRFAITYHRKLRGKGMGSVLEEVPGVGPKKRKALLDRFGSLEGLRRASVEEVSEVAGITGPLAVLIKERVGDGDDAPGGQVPN